MSQNGLRCIDKNKYFGAHTFLFLESLLHGEKCMFLFSFYTDMTHIICYHTGLSLKSLLLTGNKTAVRKGFNTEQLIGGL